jgi:hypothetical protein
VAEIMLSDSGQPAKHTIQKALLCGGEQGIRRALNSRWEKQSAFFISYPTNPYGDYINFSCKEHSDTSACFHLTALYNRAFSMSLFQITLNPMRKGN